MGEGSINRMSEQLREIVKSFKKKFSLSNKQLADLLQVHKSTIGRWLVATDNIFVVQLALERLEQKIECGAITDPGCEKRATFELLSSRLGFSIRLCRVCCQRAMVDAKWDEDGKVWISPTLDRVEVTGL